MFYRTKTREFPYGLEFFAQDGGGYVTANIGYGGQHVQICHGGGTEGETIRVKTEEGLKTAARRWMAARRDIVRRFC